MAYSAFGAAVSEVEIDVLTGEKRVLRSDIHFDCGQSLNPAVDMGQVGASASCYNNVSFKSLHAQCLSCSPGICDSMGLREAFKLLLT